MLNLEIQRILKIRAYLTPKEWGLNDQEFPTECSAVAASLNATLENYVNRGEDRETVARHVQRVMKRACQIHGATGARPQEVLNEVLDRIFAEPVHEPTVADKDADEDDDPFKPTPWLEF